MILKIISYQIWLETRLECELEVKQSDLLPDYLRIVKKDLTAFSHPQQKKMKKYLKKGSLQNTHCFHILVGEKILSEGNIVV